jgi:putative holliday junction resolvase
MRFLGIDFGTKRVGLAMTTPDGSMALPYRTIARTTREALFDEIGKIIEAEGVEAVVVGHPLRTSGDPSLTTRQACNFARSLKRRTALPVFLVREELTSCEAESMLKETGIRADRRVRVLDQIAAARILEAYLASPDNAQEVNP